MCIRDRWDPQHRGHAPDRDQGGQTDACGGAEVVPRGCDRFPVVADRPVPRRKDGCSDPSAAQPEYDVEKDGSRE